MIYESSFTLHPVHSIALRTYEITVNLPKNNSNSNKRMSNDTEVQKGSESPTDIMTCRQKNPGRKTAEMNVHSSNPKLMPMRVHKSISVQVSCLRCRHGDGGVRASPDRPTHQQGQHPAEEKDVWGHPPWSGCSGGCGPSV